MCGSTVLDKDGMSAAVKIAELAAFLQTKDLTLTQQMNKIYEECVKIIYFCYAIELYKSLNILIVSDYNVDMVITSAEILTLSVTINLQLHRCLKDFEISMALIPLRFF